MKFAHEFKEALLKEGYPQFWVNSAVPYGQLKKCLKRVQNELLELGLEPDTLRQLLATTTVSPQGQPVPIASYDLSACERRNLRPRLTVVVQLDGGVAVDASLSSSSRQALQRLAASQPDAPATNASATEVTTADAPSPHAVSTAPSRQLAQVEVPLVFDNEFFELLQTDLVALESLQRQEQETLSREIVVLRQEISTVTKPGRFSKNDLAAWRELFELYMEAQIFFSTHERDHGARTSASALSQLIWFQEQVQTLKFQEINRKAVAKILKTLTEKLALLEFDKRTSLGVSSSFPEVLPSDGFMADNAAKKICAQVADEVVSVVPRLEDYSCPVCMSIAWLPVRLACRHVFCVRCVIKMQRERKRQCPLCRGDVIMDADLSNLDKDLEKFLERYFRQETREKQKANEIERGVEVFGDSYKHSACGVM